LFKTLNVLAPHHQVTVARTLNGEYLERSPVKKDAVLLVPKDYLEQLSQLQAEAQPSQATNNDIDRVR
jgi:hypothetical protein